MENLPNNQHEESEMYEMPNVQVETIAPNGLGYGKGSISAAKRRESSDLTPGVEAIVESEVRNPNRLVNVEFNDDGCGDGRYTARLYLLEMQKTNCMKLSLNVTEFVQKFLVAVLLLDGLLTA